MKKIVYLLLGISLLISCQSDSTKEEIEVPAIRASKLFDADSVYAYMMRNGDNYQHLSHSYLKKADETKDTEKAIWYYKRAISLYPQADTYRMLGKFLIQNKKFDEALLCYELIIRHYYIPSLNNLENGTQIFGKPQSEDFENYIISGLSGNFYKMNIVYLIEIALEGGADKDELKSFIYNDIRIDLASKSDLKQQIDIVFLSEDEKKKYALKRENFEYFIQNLKTIEIPYNINFEDVQNFNYKNYRDVEYEYSTGVNIEYLERNFIPQYKENPKERIKYNKIAKLILSDSNTLVIYSIDNSKNGIEKQKRIITYYAAIYSKDLSVLDYKKIAWQENKSTATFSYNNEVFEISTFNRVWEKNEEEISPDNELKNIVFSKKEVFIIDKGKFIQKS